MAEGPIVVTGATGNVGRPLVGVLAAAGHEVRAVTRDPAHAELPDSVAVTDSIDDALDGAWAVFINSRALGADIQRVIARARRDGAAKLVALSAANADDDVPLQPSRFRGDRNKEAEQLSIDSGLRWVSLRPTVFASTTADMWAPQLRAGDVVVGPYARASFAPIVDADVAEVAAQAFLRDDLDGRRLILTGPQRLTIAAQVAVMAQVLDRPLRFKEIDRSLVELRLVAAGLSPGFADAYIALQGAAVETPAIISSEVEDILRRPPTTFAQWVNASRHLFAKTAGTATQKGMPWNHSTPRW